MEVCGGGGERNGCAVAARPNGPRRAIVRRVQKPPNETRRVAVAPTLAPRSVRSPRGRRATRSARAATKKPVREKVHWVLLPRIIPARYSEGLKIDLKAVNQIRKIVSDLNCCVIRQTRAHPSSWQRGGSPSPQPSSAPPSSTVLRSRLSSATSSSPPSPRPRALRRRTLPPPPAVQPPPPPLPLFPRSTPAPARESPVPPPTTALGTLVGTPFRTHRTLPRDVSLTPPHT